VASLKPELTDIMQRILTMAKNEHYIVVPSDIWTHIEELDVDVIQSSGSAKVATVFDSVEGHKKIMFERGPWYMEVCRGHRHG
jgi:hypothetical protein